MSASIRTNSLTLGGSGDKSLSGMSKHGRRMDRTSQERRVRDVPPLVYGSLDLRAAYDRHVEGARMNKSLKRPVLHSYVQFPTNIPLSEKTEQKMLDFAVEFINQTHGGDAVFAARLDRDEEGRHGVDVFYSPKYEKETKSHGKETWISTTKHGKELCHVHREEIESRNQEGKFVTNPRAVGIALQTELRAFLMTKGLDLKPKVEKDWGGPDRLSPEAYKADKEYRRRKALKKENESLKRALAILGEQLAPVADLVPQNVMNLLEKLGQKYLKSEGILERLDAPTGTSHDPKDRADPDPRAAPAPEDQRRTDEPPPRAPKGP